MAHQDLKQSITQQIPKGDSQKDVVFRLRQILRSIEEFQKVAFEFTVEQTQREHLSLPGPFGPQLMAQESPSKKLVQPDDWKQWLQSVQTKTINTVHKETSPMTLQNLNAI